MITISYFALCFRYQVPEAKKYLLVNNLYLCRVVYLSHVQPFPLFLKSFTTLISQFLIHLTIRKKGKNFENFSNFSK